MLTPPMAVQSFSVSFDGDASSWQLQKTECQDINKQHNHRGDYYRLIRLLLVTLDETCTRTWKMQKEKWEEPVRDALQFVLWKRTG
jgi:hypothetical protein